MRYSKVRAWVFVVGLFGMAAILFWAVANLGS